MTYEKFSMRVRGGCVMTASEHARHEEGRGRKDRAAGGGCRTTSFQIPCSDCIVLRGEDNFLVNRARASPGLSATLATSRAFHMR